MSWFGFGSAVGVGVAVGSTVRVSGIKNGLMTLPGSFFASGAGVGVRVAAGGRVGRLGSVFANGVALTAGSSGRALVTGA
ncbi:MAG TPA: hypothetical protein PJ994_13340, partial [Tepidiformaceae bacterium]|nr:hypothetical protein [Tepidiformaceae bacterium]